MFDTTASRVEYTRNISRIRSEKNTVLNKFVEQICMANETNLPVEVSWILFTETNPLLPNISHR